MPYRRDPNAPVDVIKPMTIKAVPTRTQDAINKAAAQEGLTNGQWLEKRVDEWLAAGSPVVVGPAAHDDGQPQSARVSNVVQLADAVAKLAVLPDTPDVRTARSVVRATMLTLRPPRRAVAQLPAPGAVRAAAAE